MKRSAAEDQVLEHGDGWLQVVGDAGTGRTTLLVERWRRRVRATGHPERLLVLCRSRQAADRLRDAALVGRSWAADQLAFTTFFGLAFDVVRRHLGERRLLTRAEQWNLVRRLLRDDDPTLWPSCPQLVHRAGFVDEVAAAVLAIEASGAPEAQLLGVAGRWGQGPRWQDLLAFRVRYRRATESRGALDEAQLFSAAATALADEAVARAESARWDEVLVDDGDVVTAPMGALVELMAPRTLLGAGGDSPPVGSRPWIRWRQPSTWDAAVRLDRLYRIPAVPQAVVCRHPSGEPQAIAGALWAARAEGIGWDDMAVLLRSVRGHARSIARVLARYGIPVALPPAEFDAEPSVRSIIDFFAWAGGDESALDRLLVSPAFDLTPEALRRVYRQRVAGQPLGTDHPRVAQLRALRGDITPMLGSASPADLVHIVWAPLLAGVVPDPDSRKSDPAGQRALDAVTAYVAAVSRRASHDPTWRISDELALAAGPDLDPDPWLPEASSGPSDRVTVSTIWGSGGRSWECVVVAGCLEGEFPRLSGATRFFDDAVVTEAAGAGLDRAPGGAESPPTLAQRREISLQRERRLFELAGTRARRRFLLTAAPAPGQIVSRFLAGVSRQPPADGAAVVPVPSGRELVPAVATTGVLPVSPDRRLELSASRLTTYDDCPLRYFYRYVLGVHGPGGVAASVGIVVHAALASFLDPTPQSASPSEDVVPGRQPRTWEALEAVARHMWDDEGWAATIAPYQPMREQARRDVFTMLESWWTTQSVLATTTGAWPDVVAVEYPFDIEVANHRVRGYIDRVDRVAGGLAIVDYKTGAKAMSAEDAADDLQLATYHLAALRDPALAAIGPPVSLELSYLRSGSVVSQPITSDLAARTEQRVADAADRILAEDFEPSVQADCEHCEFHRLCPLQIRGRQVVGE